MTDVCQSNEETARKVYVEPTLEKVQRLQDVTEGVPVVVTGAVVVQSGVRPPSRGLSPLWSGGPFCAGIPGFHEVQGMGAVGMSEQGEKKTYVEPELKKAQTLDDVTQGAAPVVTGAAAA